MNCKSLKSSINFEDNNNIYVSSLMMGLLNIVSQYYYAFGMVKFYSEKLEFLLVLCVLWSLKLVLSRMATKLPFLVLFLVSLLGKCNQFVCWLLLLLLLDNKDARFNLEAAGRKC